MDWGSIASIFDFTGFSSSVNAGIEESKAAREQARILEKETLLQAKEKERVNKKFIQEQELSFLKSGVILDGSPLMVLEETARLQKEDVSNIVRTGFDRAGSLRKHGREAINRGFAEGSQKAVQKVGGAFMGGM
jgi:hypothetical protein